MTAEDTVSNSTVPVKPESSQITGHQPVTPELWEAFLRARPRPVKLRKVNAQEGRKLDNQMFDFLNDAAKQTFPLRTTCATRAWLYQTAEYLNMNSKRFEAGHAWKKTLTISKSAQTGLPTNMQQAIDQHARSVAAKYQARKEHRRQAKQAKRAKIDEAIDRWSTNCEECDEHLTAWGALYHLSGMGPLCKGCVESDEEWSGLKWTPKGMFWS